ncbi:MAG: glycosyltransferase [Spirochaetales bacterium]|nr:glycosyltransferase [Spirochaetales bacterium]
MNSREELISIIVPARDEEKNIIPCLETLVKQNFTAKEIIVVNDGSSDKTEELVKKFIENNPEVRLINGKPMPDGWIGKTYALSQGLENAAGNYVLFTDADSRHKPHALSTVFKKLINDKAAVLSILPFLESVTFWEKVIQPFVGEMFLVSMPFKKVNDMNSKVVLCNGQFLLTRKDVIESIGGLAAIKGNILDDIAFARLVKDSKRKISLYYGGDLFSVRMYSGLKDILNGWSKNFYRGFTLNYHELMIIPAVLAILLLFILPFLLPIFAVILPGFTLLRLSISLLPMFIEVAITYLKRKKHNIYPETSWTIGIAAFFYIYIMIVSTVRTVFGIGVKWKGRSYYKKR